MPTRAGRFHAGSLWLGPLLLGPSLLSLLLLVQACSLPWGIRRQPSPRGVLGLGAESRQDPALSGDGRLLASLVLRSGRSTVLLQDRRSGQTMPLPLLRGQQPHSSPSLSWNGRYLALLVWRGGRRQVVINDRATNRLLPLPLGATGRPSGSASPRMAAISPWSWWKAAKPGWKSLDWGNGWNPIRFRAPCCRAQARGPVHEQR